MGPDGTRHLRFDRTYGGLPVIGGDLVVHQGADGTLRSVDRAVGAKLALPSLTPALSADQAAAQATGTVRASLGSAEDRDEQPLREVSGAGRPTLVVWAVDGTPRLAYQTAVEGVRADGTPSRQQLVTDAATGQLLSSHEEIHTVSAGTGTGVYVGRVPLTTNLSSGTYQLKDTTRGGQYTTDLKHRTSGNGTLYTDADNLWGDGTVSNGSTVTGIGRDKAAQVWYHALTEYMTSTTDYAGARTATLNAAAALYGSTSTEYTTVRAAWAAVNVGTP